MRNVTVVLLASVLCLSIFLAPVTATAAEGIGSGLALEAGFGCKMQDGKLVCGKTSKSDDSDDDDDDDDDDDKPKKKEVETGLTECTIQQPGGGGGCKGGFKWTCEKLKSGKKCCGCVPDPNAKPAEAQQPVVQKICCTASSPSIGNSITYCRDTEADARQTAESQRFNDKPPENITCSPEK